MKELSKQLTDYTHLRGLCLQIKKSKGEKRQDLLKNFYDKIRDYKFTYHAKFDMMNRPE